jgi:hypothetical protein
MLQAPSLSPEVDQHQAELAEFGLQSAFQPLVEFFGAGLRLAGLDRVEQPVELGDNDVLGVTLDFAFREP